ncbi:MAG TPA: FGGY family carbohydrate kinase, partial [Chloroflexota bacterium]|nr:FGGY family carbohydrate kinase [Chloroflexota bacterium]
MQLYIGLDLGTSAVKALALDERGRVAAQASASYPTTAPAPGWAEQDPADWTRATHRALADLLSRAPMAARPRAIALTGQLPTLVVLNLDGNALCPAIVWYDGRAEAEAESLCRQVDAETWYRRSGIVLDAHYLAPMYRWLARHSPATLSAPHRVCSAKDALLHALTGEWYTDPSTASGYGTYDPIGGAWDPLLCGVAGLHGNELPGVRQPHTVVGTLVTDPGVARLLKGTPVVLGAGDALTGVLGCGGAAAATLAAITGTSTSMVVSIQAPRLDPGRRFLLSPHALPELWASEMDLMATGSALRWLAGIAGITPHALLDRAMAAPPGAHGVVAFPHLAGGEQGALWDPRAPAAFVGMSLGTTLDDLARALLEGIAFEMRRCLAVWQEAQVPIQEIVLAGGLATPFVAALSAAALALPVRRAGLADASAFGAALLAGIGVG